MRPLGCRIRDLAIGRLIQLVGEKQVQFWPPRETNSSHWVRWWRKLPIEVWVIALSPTPNDEVYTDYRADSDMYNDANSTFAMESRMLIT